MNAKVNNRVKAYTRVGFSKYSTPYYEETATSFPFTNLVPDAASSRREEGPQAYFERAFVDFSITDNLVFSFGRLPTIDGPPVHFASGKARMGTYPALTYNATLDGYALSYNMGTDHQFAARFIYTPMSQIPSGGVLTNPAVGRDVYDLLSVMFEYESRALSFADHVNVIYHGYQFDGAPFNPTDTRTLIDTLFGVSSTGASGLVTIINWSKT